MVGAKGFAHIGVLKVPRRGVKIDYIGGTSMGAVVGGFMPDIMLLKSILFFVQQFDELINDFIPRSSKTFMRREMMNCMHLFCLSISL
jgi:NTE family protein